MERFLINDFALDNVTLTDDYCANAFEKEVEYLVSFDIDRILAGFRETAGLDTKGKLRYPGWENMLIGGHCAGHYISACANAYRTPNCKPEHKAALKEILTQIIDGLTECQNALGTGFIFGAQIKDKNNVELQFDFVEKGKTNIITEAWVPWYTMHKIIEGLLGVASLNGGECAELAEGSKQILAKLTDWIYNRGSKWDEQTHKTVLSIEYGGMNDCLYSVYLLTGNETALKAAHFFDDETLFKTISWARIGQNVLKGRHANTTIPKFIGSVNRYVATGEESFLNYGKKFWDLVVGAHTYVTGGNSTWEHFGEDNNLYSKLSNCNCETCNSYNMLKLTKMLYMITGEKKYADWYEHTFRNSILASQNPDTGMTTYFQPMGTGYFKVYNTPYNSFWCCTGTGMENFSKLGESFYYVGAGVNVVQNNSKDVNKNTNKQSDMSGKVDSESRLYVNQYISSILDWKAEGFKVIQKSTVPVGNSAVFNFEGNYEGEIAFRIPQWCYAGVEVALNGEKCEWVEDDGFAVLTGKFTEKSEIKITLPMKITAYNLPDKKDSYAFQYGPVVLSALLGAEEKKTAINGVNVTVPERPLIEGKYVPSQSDIITVKQISVKDFIENINEYLVRDESYTEDLHFNLKQTDSNLVYIPHYLQCNERYGLYFRFLDEKSSKELMEDKTSLAYINSKKLDTVQPGYGQYENDDLHKMTEYGNGSAGQTYHGTSRWAKAGGSFSYRMIVDPAGCELLVSFDPGDDGKTIKIKAGEKVIFEGKVVIKNKKGFNTVILPLEKDVLAGAVEKITVDGKLLEVVKLTFSGVDGAQSAQICEFLYTLKK